MSLALQTKVLRALDQKRFRRLGGTSDILVETRIVGRDESRSEGARPAGKIPRGPLLPLDVIRIMVPPLRERPRTSRR